MSRGSPGRPVPRANAAVSSTRPKAARQESPSAALETARRTPASDRRPEAPDGLEGPAPRLPASVAPRLPASVAPRSLRRCRDDLRSRRLLASNRGAVLRYGGDRPVELVEGRVGVERKHARLGLGGAAGVFEAGEKVEALPFEGAQVLRPDPGLGVHVAELDAGENPCVSKRSADARGHARASTHSGRCVARRLVLRRLLGSGLCPGGQSSSLFADRPAIPARARLSRLAAAASRDGEPEHT